jgi:hypothetical protein
MSSEPTVVSGTSGISGISGISDETNKIDGDILRMSAAPAPATGGDATRRRHTQGIRRRGDMALLRRPEVDWSIEEWQGYYNERAAIAEYDGGLFRAEAEARA